MSVCICVCIFANVRTYTHTVPGFLFMQGFLLPTTVLGGVVYDAVVRCACWEGKAVVVGKMPQGPPYFLGRLSGPV